MQHRQQMLEAKCMHRQQMLEAKLNAQTDNKCWKPNGMHRQQMLEAKLNAQTANAGSQMECTDNKC